MRRFLVLALMLFAAPAHAQPAPMPTGQFEGATFPAHWARRPLLDEARAAANVDVAWARFGVQGRGATVCVIDTGVDLTHRDFVDTGGHTRADWVLDLDRAPRGSEPALEARFGGAVFRHDELDALLAARDPNLPGDWHGHGTAMASAALGDDAPLGSTSPGTRAGIAPEARLVVVRALRRGTPGFADEDIARGVAFCAAVTTPGRAVALLSLGGHDGPHDGTSAIERALDAFVRAGLPIVVAAGNDGGRAIHAATRVAADTTGAIALRIPAAEDTDGAHVAVTVRGTTDVALVGPDHARASVHAVGERDSVRTARATLTVDATREGVVDVIVSGDAAHPLLGGDFVIEARGPAEVDAWMASVELGSSIVSATFRGAGAIAGEEVSIPATSEQVIAVGASVSRDALVTSDGSPTLTLDADGEGRALFSSRGPSASGAARPDLLAPGGWIVTARSAQVDPTDPESLVHGRAPDWSRISRPDQRMAIAGTSVSAAIVAGALALAAEAAQLDPARDRDALAFSAVRDTDEAFTPARGYGRLDVAGFLAVRTPITTPPMAPALLSATRAFSTPGAHDLSLILVTRTSSDATITFTRDGETIGQAQLRAGIARMPVDTGRAVPGSSVTWAASLGGATLATTSTPIAWTDDGAGAIASGGAGCAAHVGRSWWACALVIAALLGWARARRSRTLSA